MRDFNCMFNEYCPSFFFCIVPTFEQFEQLPRRSAMPDCWESAILPLILQVSSIVYQIPFSEYEFVHLFFKDYVFKICP